ncbi:MAG: 4Fe-4S binding protein [Methanosphaera sp.]|uniref:4Fe-4S binding protein n=1 Tax=Methanosphaera sp. TaxID=2666342 RepID=UPI0025F55681|nr:4Fe-4S binding protein [Methanosphaera sp.]MCI5867154.1 4Fe-4S binding protein [Methanosphaera sp.]MDD6534777.1 4Fe-4S binding protein [Methanosphaera sp.]MDY3955555.1 4Fe-4S binding protein [Methanosphaera sp.]
MIIKEHCMYCGACAGVCIVDAIEVQELKIVIDEEKCTKCGICVKTCPIEALELQ